MKEIRKEKEDWEFAIGVSTYFEKNYGFSDKNKLMESGISPKELELLEWRDELFATPSSRITQEYINNLPILIGIRIGELTYFLETKKHFNIIVDMYSFNKENAENLAKFLSYFNKKNINDNGIAISIKEKNNINIKNVFISELENKVDALYWIQANVDTEEEIISIKNIHKYKYPKDLSIKYFYKKFENFFEIKKTLKNIFKLNHSGNLKCVYYEIINGINIQKEKEINTNDYEKDEILKWLYVNLDIIEKNKKMSFFTILLSNY